MRTMMKTETLRRDGETLDTFYHGRIRLLQKRKGYRFSVDAPLLADFVRTGESDEILDLGAGNGVISLLLSIKPFRRATAIEVQADLADMALRNVALNGLEERIEVVRQDLREWNPGRAFDLIVANPPYVRKAGGFLCRLDEKSVAKHEVLCTLDDILGRTAEWLRPDGRACFIYPERRRADFARAADVRGFRISRFRQVLPRASAPAQLFLMEVGFTAGEPEIMPPLVLFDEAGNDSAEAEAIFSGRP
jgi:tRNA1Val (adenine37-N6)-methyltransferase